MSKENTSFVDINKTSVCPLSIMSVLTLNGFFIRTLRICLFLPRTMLQIQTYISSFTPFFSQLMSIHFI